jgi:multiple sugar transport system ATP-binding protein
MVAGLEEATGGEIYIGDRLVNDAQPGNRDIAMVFQNYALYPHMSVYQNMAFGLKMRRTPKAPRELSGGQRQRVALGRAIVREPKVFLFDEPLSNLDAKLRVQMRAEIARLHARLKTTIIYVTHDQVEAMTLGDRIVLLNHGVIQQVDAPMEIYRRPVNRFVASFIGSPAMNFISGKIRSGAFQFEANGEGAVAVVETNASDGPAVLGIRPEDMVIASDGPTLGTVTLDVVEHMGHETIAHFALAGGEHVARLAADASVGPGDRLSLSIRPGAFHLFSADDGRRLN